MKNIMYALVLLITINVAAQGKDHRGKKMMNDLTPEQMATLHTKKLTLMLDLNENQQQRVLALQTEVAKKRKTQHEIMKARKEKGEKLSNDERYKIKVERMDAKIAHKKQMKSILTNEQYEKWEKMHAHKGKKKRRHKGERKHKQ